jgi:hypothetical protein
MREGGGNEGGREGGREGRGREGRGGREKNIIYIISIGLSQ